MISLSSSQNAYSVHLISLLVIQWSVTVELEARGCLISTLWFPCTLWSGPCSLLPQPLPLFHVLNLPCSLTFLCLCSCFFFCYLASSLGVIKLCKLFKCFCVKYLRPFMFLCLSILFLKQEITKKLF